MKIFIDEIDPLDLKPLGCTNMIGYPAHFRCTMFHGWARFVPADENVQAYLDNEIDVEIDFSKGGVDDLETVSGCCFEKTEGF